jgi:gliding motility-associated-like protein
LTEPACFGALNGRIKLLVTGGQIPYRYSLNNGAFGGSSTFIALEAGAYTLTVMDAFGCSTTQSATLDQPPAIVVTLPSDTTVVYGDSIFIQGAVANGVGMLDYEWSSSLIDSLVCTDTIFCDEILIKPVIGNYYRLQVTDENGCIGRSQIHVKVEKPRGVYVPTAFSPNGDFTNDLLVVHGLSKHVESILYFRVYDRWGELLYEDLNFAVNETNRGWSGEFRGQDSDPGVYVWVLEVKYNDGKREVLKGDVTLIR